MISLVLSVAFLLQQQPPALKTISDLASSLSEGNPAGAMSTFDKSIPNYQTISNNIYALTAQADISCSIDPVDQNGNEVEVDWFLMLQSKEEHGTTERRQMTVKLTIVKAGKNYKITAITPASILDPPKQ